MLSFILISCKKENVAPVYYKIPAKYNNYFQTIRLMEDSALLNVKSNTGLIDELSLNTKNSIKKYTNIAHYNNIPGANEIEINAEYYSQTHVPKVYNFYNFNYYIDFEAKNSDNQIHAQDINNYIAGLKISNEKIFEISLTNFSIVSKYPYTILLDFNLNNILYPKVYKIDMSSGAKPLKIVYFTFESGVIQFETFSNEIFDISL